MLQTTARSTGQPHTAVAYRSDIDGLRAVAVLSVIIFHAKLGLFPGGFVGVDVFFVISGYLIASIILKEEERDSFSLARFYERRIRRIFPALLLVIVFCVGAGALLLTPNDYLLFGRSAFAAMAFWSNFYFSRQGGYFAPAAETQPLLHTWSLGVEEQFYLVAPFLLLLLSRQLKKWRAPIFWALFIASLGVSAWGVFREEAWAFYLPHSRAFELMCGVALAMGLVPRVHGRANEALAALGLAMIAYAVLFYSAATPFPGFAALLPAVGAALLIHTSSDLSQTMVARALSLSPVVFIGKISYSLYLWHWPLLVFAEYQFGHDLQAWHRVLLLLAAVAISAVAYHFIEQPARRMGPPLTRKLVFAAGAAAIILTAALSQIIVKGRGLPGRLDPEIAALARATPTRVQHGGLCGFGKEGRQREREDCFIGDQAASAPRFVLWGDSHAAAVGPMIAKLATDSGVKGYNVGRGGCPPLFGLEKESSVFRRCLAGARDMDRVLADPNVEQVILVGRWGLYAEGVASLNEAATRPRRFVARDDEANRAAFARVLTGSVERIRAAGKRVVLVGPVPEFELNVPAAFIKGAMRGAGGDITMARATFDERQRGVMPTLAKLSQMEGVRVVYPHLQLCDALVCRATAGGKALYVDDDHLSPAGALLIEQTLRSSLDGVRK
ncbi:MAG: acyltransferase family protein [Beijerinckiaceae bacterium]|nr:acyltransferase family protein [Beijerinckiaceae bacterium]